MQPYLKLLIWIVGYMGVSFALGQITHGEIPTWYANLNKPSFNPPSIAFPIVWGILYVMIATAGWRLWQKNASKEIKIIYIIYTLMNWAWTPIFFGGHQMAIGFFWIVGINAVNFLFLMRAWNAQRVSAILMIPVFLWTLFAMVLNYNIWQLNV